MSQEEKEETGREGKGSVNYLTAAAAEAIIGSAARREAGKSRWSFSIGLEARFVRVARIKNTSFRDHAKALHWSGLE